VCTHLLSGGAMQIIINERALELAEESTLADVVERLRVSRNGMAVAVNRTIVPFDKWQEYRLQENDAVMIIQATQGG
jgi:thiamine biosynthesis protein ThiS